MVLPPGPVATYQQASFVAGGRSIVFVGAEGARPQRTWVQQIPAGEPRPVTPEGVAGIVTSPDGKLVSALTGGGRLVAFPITGQGEPRVLTTLTPAEGVRQWSDDGRTLYLSRPGTRLQVVALDLASGTRRPWRTFELADPAGGRFWNIVMSRDARSYAYCYMRTLAELYVVEGLK